MNDHLLMALGQLLTIAGLAMFVFFALLTPVHAQAGSAAYPHTSGIQQRSRHTPGLSTTPQGVSTPPPKAAAAQGAPTLLYRFMDFFVRLTGARSYSYSLALLLISLLSRLVLWPFTVRQARSAAQLQALQPEVSAIQAKHKDDPLKLHQELTRLYKERGISPSAGFVLAIPQMLLLFVLYQAVWQYHNQFSNGAFLWIGSPWSTAHPHFMATSLAAPDLLLITLYAASMIITQRPVPAAEPAMQQMQAAMRWLMPLGMGVTIWLSHTASAFVLYWLISNLITAVVQTRVSRLTVKATQV